MVMIVEKLHLLEDTAIQIQCELTV